MNLETISHKLNEFSNLYKIYRNRIDTLLMSTIGIQNKLSAIQDSNQRLAKEIHNSLKRNRKRCYINLIICIVLGIILMWLILIINK